jgi:hypothetical protein
MGTSSISREQCSIRKKKVSVQTEATEAAVTMESVNKMAESSSIRLCVLLALMCQCRRGIAVSSRICVVADRLRKGLPSVEVPNWRPKNPMKRETGVDKRYGSDPRTPIF